MTPYRCTSKESSILISGVATIVRIVHSNDESIPDRGFHLPTVLLSSKRGNKILAYAEMWLVNGEDEDDVKKKLEELVWVATLLYGVSGYQGGKDFKSDFFLYAITSLLTFRVQLTDFPPGCTL